MGQDAYGRGLKPVDAHRLLEARLVLEVDRDEIAALQHLHRRLGEARLVAVEGRQGDQSRQAGQQGDQGREGGPPPAAAPNLETIGPAHESHYHARRVRTLTFSR